MKREQFAEMDSSFDVSKFIVNQWGLSGRLAIQDFSSRGYYGGVLKITDSFKSYALKSYPKSSLKLLRFSSRLFSFLESKGFTNFPEFLATKDGEEFVVSPSGGFCSLSPWIDGEQIVINDTQSGNRDKVKIFARTVARLHEATRGFEVDEDTIVDETIADSWASELVERHQNSARIVDQDNNLFSQMQVDEDLRKLLIRTKPLVELFGDRKGISAMEDKFTKNIVHADLWIGHWLFGLDNKPYILDFDRVRFGRKIDDVERIVSESMQLGNECTRIALTEYLQVGSLTEEELKALPLLIQYGVVRRTFWLIDQFIKRGQVVQNGPLDLHQEIIRATEIIDSDINGLLFK